VVRCGLHEQRNASDPTFGPYPPLTNPPAAGEAAGAGGLFTHTQQFTAIFNTTDVVVVVVVIDEMKKNGTHLLTNKLYLAKIRQITLQYPGTQPNNHRQLPT